jgi:hypothetical protein
MIASKFYNFNEVTVFRSTATTCGEQTVELYRRFTALLNTSLYVWRNDNILVYHVYKQTEYVTRINCVGLRYIPWLNADH